MTRSGFKSLGPIVLGCALLAACSPISPSVSKLSNTTAQKTSGEDTSAALRDVVKKAGKPGLAEAGARTVTEVVPTEEFKSHVVAIPTTHPTIVVPGDEVVKFRSADGRSAIASGEDVGADDPALANTNIRVLLSVRGTDGKSIETLQKSARIAVAPCVTEGLAHTCDTGHDWALELKPVPAEQDPIAAIAQEEARSTLLKNLKGIAIEFRADLQN